MALGGIILYAMNGLGMSTPRLFASGTDHTVEFRVRFPLAADTTLTPSELSGALWTLSSGSSMVSCVYEKESVSGQTGTIYVTSSLGRLSVASASIFDDRFYNISYVRRRAEQVATLRIMRHEDGRIVYHTSGSTTGAVTEAGYIRLDLGSSPLVPSSGQFWGQELRLWSTALSDDELLAHSLHFESYGRSISHSNDELIVHWRLAEGFRADSNGALTVLDSTPAGNTGSAVGFPADTVPYQKFLEDYSYIPSIDGWDQEKVRVFSGSRIDPLESYDDDNLVSLEFNMYDALNEDISHMMVSYDELTNFLGVPVNRYREEYEGLVQMRETYFKRLQGQLNFRIFADMLDFFDSSFSSLVERLLPARTNFRGDEMVVESHMLERPKYQYNLRPIVEGRIEISGSISIVDREDDW